MDLIFLVILIALTISMFSKNFKKAGQYRKDKTYIDIYTKILKEEEGAYDELVSYLGSETDACLKAKSTLIKIYVDLDKAPELVEADVDGIDFMHDIFFEGENFLKERIISNSEVFIWLILILSKARANTMIDAMNHINDKVSVYDEEMKDYVEYQVYKSAYSSLLEKDVEGINFLKVLLCGEYHEYKYDKNLIGIYKKIAASLLAYMAEPLDDGDDELIKEFTQTLIGSRFTKDLEIYDRFHVEEVEEESSEELYSDNEETLAEENSKKTSDASESKEDETSQDDKDTK